MTNKQSNVGSSAQTDESAERRNPFRRGSVRGQAFVFLQIPRTMAELRDFAEEQGVNAQSLLRYFRKQEYETMWLREEGGKIQWVVEGVTTCA